MFDFRLLSDGSYSSAAGRRVSALAGPERALKTELGMTGGLLPVWPSGVRVFVGSVPEPLGTCGQASV